MKFNFKIQQYQTDAVEAVARVFAGQGLHENARYRRDVGKISAAGSQLTMSGLDAFDEIVSGVQIQGFFDGEDDLAPDIGYKNEQVELSDEQLLQNIQPFIVHAEAWGAETQNIHAEQFLHLLLRQGGFLPELLHRNGHGGLMDIAVHGQRVSVCQAVLQLFGNPGR